MIRRPPRSTQSRSSAASDVYKRQMPCLSQNWVNSLLNCGPPSVHIAVGQPTSMNQSDSCPTTDTVSVRRSSCVQAYPEYLSTSTIHFLPIASNRSVPTSFMGYSAEEGWGIFAVGLACAGLSSLHTRQLSIVCLIEFFMPCLLYTSPSPRDKRQSRMPSSA